MASMRRRLEGYEKMLRDHKSGGGGDSGAGTTTQKMIDSVKDRASRIKLATVNPSTVFLKLLDGLRYIKNWPFHKDVEERVSADYIGSCVSNGQTLFHHAQVWNRAHGFEDSKVGEYYERIMLAVDKLMNFDGVDVVNSAGVEVLMKYAYGFERASANCTKA